MNNSCIRGPKTVPTVVDIIPLRMFLFTSSFVHILASRGRESESSHLLQACPLWGGLHFHDPQKRSEKFHGPQNQSKTFRDPQNQFEEFHDPRSLGVLSPRKYKNSEKVHNPSKWCKNPQNRFKRFRELQNQCKRFGDPQM